MNRRGSSSSVETVSEKIINRRMQRETVGPCVSCRSILFDSCNRKTGSRTFTGIDVLRSCARKCPMCRLFWQVLCGADNTVVDRIINYSNDSFNNVGLYLPDGGTDIEELVNPGSKVDISVTARLHNPEVYSVVQTPVLRLKFLITYKAQTEARIRATTVVGEDVIIFRVADAHNTATNGSDDDQVRSPSPILQDPRLESDKKWDLFSLWLEKSQSKGQTFHSNSFPTRILDLSLEHKVVLRVNAGKPYVALSHRWGTSQHLTATTATLEQLKAGISLELLPATFKDAVLAARRLGVYSLWIDALCIVQDDQEEWRSESQKMGGIYTNAKFVIAVHCAADDSKGFLAEALAKRSTIDFKNLDGKEDVAIYRRSNLDRDVTRSALSERGWVLQERLLATHTLHFTTHGVISESREGVFSEDGRPNSKFKSPCHLFRQLLTLPKLQIASTSSDTVQETKVFCQQVARRTPLDWLAIVEQYTKCDLTREGDKLIAIAGMAGRICSRIGSKWCAGIWSDRISEGLLWLPEREMSRPTHSRAPSWSWAAWDGPVQYPCNVADARFRPRAKFRAIYERGLATSWLAGPGILRVQANMVSLNNVVLTGDQIQLGPGPDRRGYFTSDNKDLPRLGLKHYLNVHTLRGRRNANKRLVVREDRLPRCGWVALDDYSLAPRPDLFEDSRNLEQAWFALLGAQRASSGGILYLGVFLTFIEDENQGKPGKYRRIGCGQLSHSFISGETVDSWSPRDDELLWSNKSDVSFLQVPETIITMTTIDIE